MKCFDPRSELLRFAAHFVQRRQPVENVKSRVLDSLGHDRAGVLLKFQNEMLVSRRGLLSSRFSGKPQQKQIAQEVEDRFFDARVASFGRAIARSITLRSSSLTGRSGST